MYVWTVQRLSCVKTSRKISNKSVMRKTDDAVPTAGGQRRLFGYSSRMESQSKKNC